MSVHQERDQIFKQAVLYVADRGGEAAVLRAFGDPQPIDELWELELPDFRQGLRSRVREALNDGRGAA